VYPHLRCVPNHSEGSNLDKTPSGKETMHSSRNGVSVDKGQTAESWVALCAQAVVEQDPKRLLELVKEINGLLDARKQRLFNEEDRHSKPQDQLKDGKSDGRDHDLK
jgi:hypothetical protein